MIRQKPDYNRVLKKSSNITKMFLKEFSDLKSNDHSVLNTSDPAYSFHVSSWEVGKKDNKKESSDSQRPEKKCLSLIVI